MAPAEPKSLCVAIHDVAPATWPDCQRLLAAVRAVADIPLTLLVVPHYHRGAHWPAAYDGMLADLLAQGHELALHGYFHLDTAPLPGRWRERFLRRVYTEGEGEFAALDMEQARRRLERGLAWFGRRNWPVRGFVAPAWLLSKGAWAAVRALPFEYTTTLRYFHCLAPDDSVFAPSLVYAARNGVGRRLSPCCARPLAWLQQSAPLIRLGLHPRDARHPALLRHAQRLIGDLLASRRALTKADFARSRRAPA
ncbi:polysaccharide deacetylase family protein [Janthinobacterium fluminis]|uniref:Polysaccharide deacetylase family protein n=1 Tax=Janthinobacterium fluminis TaxID=2987524 RepID=A0ABT5K062_9BURK|nr:polysaccharide deacetylase family protein [Janthinobacterium fluminis]MDC8758363.1 polysaccharide deacetylase family protein [Janthinobacterium fluminis]